MNVQELQAMKQARLARETAQMDGDKVNKGVIILPAPGDAEVQRGAEGKSPVVVEGSDSEETRASLPLKRKRREKSVTSGATAPDSMRPPPIAAVGGTSSGAGSGELQIRSTGGLVAFLFTLIHNARVSADFSRSLDSVQREREARAEKIKEMKAHAAEAQKLLQKSKTLIKQREEEIKTEKGKVASCQELVKQLEKEKEGWVSKEAALAGEMAKIKERGDELEMVVLEKDSEIGKLRARIQALEDSVVDQHEKSYSEALAHVKFFHLDEDLARYDAYEEIKNGEYVRPSGPGS